jgi:hypothetical protein
VRPEGWGTLEARIMAALYDAPNGLTCTAIAEQVGSTAHTVGIFICKYTVAGTAKRRKHSRRWPGKRTVIERVHLTDEARALYVPPAPPAPPLVVSHLPTLTPDDRASLSAARTLHPDWSANALRHALGWSHRRYERAEQQEAM